MKRLVLRGREKQPAVQPGAGDDVWIGIDIARSKWAFDVRWQGKQLRHFATPGDIEHLKSLVKRYEHCRLHVVYEACGFGWEIAWWCQEQKIAITVVAPSTIEKAPGRGVKTDRIDAAMLNRKNEQGQLKSVLIPTRAIHEQRQLSRTYEQIVKSRKRAQTQLRSMMQDHGRIGPMPRLGWASYERWLRSQSLPPPVAVCVEQLLAQRAAAVVGAQRLKTELRKVAASPAFKPVVKRLSQQRGVAWLTAIRVMLEIGTIERFTTADSFPNYLGLTPSEHSSGDGEPHRGHVRKCGPGHVRAWFIQCAWAAVRGEKADAKLLAVFQRIQNKSGKKIAIVAVARRLALRIRARWREEIREMERPQAA